MEFRQLEVFTLIAELKSFSKTAEYMYLSQSTVSSHIINLEKELQKKLIVRTTKSLRLTEEGLSFLTYAKRIIETRDAAIDALNTSTETILHLGASSIPSAYLLPQILGNFHRKYPSIRFNIKQGDSMEIEQKLLDGTIDLGFIGEKSSSNKLICEAFCEDELVLVTPSNRYYTNLWETQPTIATLLKEPLILREPGSGTQKAIERFFSKLRINSEHLNIIAQINDLEAIKQLILRGMGISILSRFSIRDLEKNNQVILYPLKPEVKREFYLSYLKSKTLRPILQTFVDFTFL